MYIIAYTRKAFGIFPNHFPRTKDMHFGLKQPLRACA